MLLFLLWLQAVTVRLFQQRIPMNLDNQITMAKAINLRDAAVQDLGCQIKQQKELHIQVQETAIYNSTLTVTCGCQERHLLISIEVDGVDDWQRLLLIEEQN